jgi:hypothetical protein
MLLDEIPSSDLDGQKMLVSKYFKADLKIKVDELAIAKFRNELKMKFFLYKRKKSRWITLV